MGDCQSKNKVAAVSEPVKHIGVDTRVPVKNSGNQAVVSIKDSEIQTDPIKEPVKEKASKPENGRSGEKYENLLVKLEYKSAILAGSYFV